MWQSVRVPFLTILFAFISLFVFSKIFGPIPFSVNSITTIKENLFTVSASADATGVPDTALLSLGISKNAPTVKSAKEQVNKIMNQVTSDLKGLGIAEKDIKTTNYSVSPEYDYIGGTDKLKGYIVNANIEARIESIEKANKAIDLATKNGANQIGGIQFILNDEDRSKLENQARKEAIGKAKEKAKSIADAAGIKLGRIMDVQEDSAPEDLLPYARSMMALDVEQKDESTDLSPGENTITSTVTLSYETF